MILNFEREIDEIYELCGGFDTKTGMKIAMVLMAVFDKGISFERERNIHIIQKLSVNAMDVVREIRKPLR